MSDKSLNDVKQLAKKIADLASDLQSKLDADGDFLPTANELVRNNLTLVFSLGQFYADKGAKPSTVKTSGGTKNYHNLRDNRGRFTRKV